MAEAIGAPLDVIVVRKLGLPCQPELAVGAPDAIGEDGARVLNNDIIREAHLTATELEAIEARERVEVERRAARLRGDRPRIRLRGASPSSWTTASLQAPPPAPPARSPRRPGRRKWCWPFRSERPTRSPRSGRRRTPSYVWTRRCGSGRSASGTPTSPRCPTTRCSSCSMPRPRRRWRRFPRRSTAPPEAGRQALSRGQADPCALRSNHCPIFRIVPLFMATRRG